MKEKELNIDYRYHVIYTKQCKKHILKAIKEHYGKEDVDSVWEKVQLQYVDFLKNYRTDLGGKKNKMNCLGGTYDSIMLFSYYSVCKEVTSFKEIETIYENLFLSSFKKLSFVNLNNKVYKKLYYKVLTKVLKIRNKFKDYNMVLEPYKKGEPIKYHFTTCPVYEFAKEHDLLDILPALCNCDYKGIAVMHSKLVRTGTLKTSDRCDYAIYGDKDAYLKEHPEYIGPDGGVYNK